jgi:hypothetical protein
MFLQSAAGDVVGIVGPSGVKSVWAAGAVDTGITAFATGGQASATQLKYRISEVTVVVTAADSVKLPTADEVGMSMLVINHDSAESMNVFPLLGEFINQLAVNTALAVAANTATIFTVVAPGRWRSK